MIRKLKSTDRDAYQYLKLESFKYKDNHPFTPEIFERSFVWEENDELIGFCKWIEAGWLSKYAEITCLMVNPRYRLRGIAKALVTETVKDALKHFDNIRIYDSSRYGQTSKIAKELGFLEKDTREWWLK